MVMVAGRWYGMVGAFVGCVIVWLECRPNEFAGFKVISTYILLLLCPKPKSHFVLCTYTETSCASEGSVTS